MVKFNKYKLELKLEAQMPMIHFQMDQTGVTLRATEVKPKLDRYLLGKIKQEAGKDDLDKLKKDENYKDLFLDPTKDENDALDYKIQIIETKSIEGVELNKKRDKSDPNSKDENYSIYYGNIKKVPEEKKYGVYSNPTVTVICFVDKLRRYIEENIETFFIITNFGTMQNKGFGSFIPAEWCPEGKLSKEKKQAVAKAYAEIIPGGKCYAMEFEGLPQKNAPLYDRNLFCIKMSESIKTFYSMMKSGINLGEKGYSRSYIYIYAHERLGLGNEKAWMKRNEISPNLSKPGNEKKWDWCDETYRYMRAFLGIGEQITYIGGTENKIPKKDKNTDVIVKIDSEFERINSPIYFKVIRNVVFIVAFEIPEELYGTEFTFTNTRDNSKKGMLKTPEKEELANTDNKFDVQDFLKCYIEYYNKQVMKKEIISLKKAPKVEEVKLNA